MEHKKEQEAIYIAQEDSHVVMSEKVQALAGSIYQEFEKMIHKYDETVVKELMPLVVNVLECLDLSYTENQEHEVEVELLREDNEQLVTQYEREKQLRKASEQKLLGLEDQSEEEIKDLTSKTESLEAIVRMLELKSKNSSDHVSRLEEKETETKKEYAKLHDRYTELFKTHMDYMERTKILMGTDRLENFGLGGMKKLNAMTRSAGPVSFGFSSLENNSMLKSFASPDPSTPSHPFVPSSSSTVNIQEEMSMEEAMEDVTDHPIEMQNGSDSKGSGLHPPPQQGKSHNKKEERTGNTLYQEFSFHDPDVNEEQGEITGSWVHPGEYASSDVCSDLSSASPPQSNVNDNFFGMGKEVENLILENNELLATKNALNIVKDDLIAKVDELTSEQEILREEIQSLQAVKSRMKLRISELEEEMKRMREEAEKRTGGKSDDEDDIPLAQRKRFTRVEMARVLMERNQYKERFMELQDAVRWTEMLRAARQDPSLEKKTNKGIVSFFSSLFGKSTPPVGLTTDRLVSSGGIVSHSSPTKPGSAVAVSSMGADGLRGTVAKTEMSAEKLQLRRLGDTQGKRDPGTYKQTRAHVRKDDGRMQAYGWSLPAKPKTIPTVQFTTTKETPTRNSMSVNEISTAPSNSTHGKHLPVPVPIYCRPFMEQTPGMKIFCACGVNLKGWKNNENNATSTNPSPHVWICTATHSASRVTVIDANRPQDLLQTFDVCSSHLLCVTSVPAASADDLSRDTGLEYLDSNGISNGNSDDCFGQLSFVEVTEETNLEHSSRSVEPQQEDVAAEAENPVLSTEILEEPETASQSVDQVPEPRASEESLEETVTETEEDPNVSSALPTMWLGAQNGFVYVHSAIAHWNKCLHKVRLPDSVLSIAHLRGRTFVSMANGTVAIFRRGNDGQWDLASYHLLDLGKQPHHSIRCLSAVRHDIWCGFRNKIHVVDLYTFKVKTTLEAHPRKESQVRQMACCGDGVWVSIRLDSTLRLYHAETFEHLQDVDIEPYVSKMLGTGKLGFSYARITALLVASSRLWIGTGNGVIISVPLQESTVLPNPTSLGTRGPGSILRIAGDREEPGREIPYCSMSQAQLSFHGHRDAVKFFVAVPGSSNRVLLNNEPIPAPFGSSLVRSNSILVISGGEGYIDFRVGDGDDPDVKASPDPNHPSEKAHIIIWQVSTTSQLSATGQSSTGTEQLILQDMVTSTATKLTETA